MSDSLNDKSKNKRLGNNKQKNTTASVYREIY